MTGITIPDEQKILHKKDLKDVYKVTEAIGAAILADGNLASIDTLVSDIKDAVVAAIPAGENHVGEVGGKTVMVSGELTRVGGGDTNAYAANDVVSNSTTTTTPVEIANLARINGGSGYITGARLTTNQKSITPRFRVHLFSSNDATLAGDNLPHKELYADISKRIGSFDLPNMATGADSTNSDMSRALDFNLRIPFHCGANTKSIWYVLETLDAFTPTSGQKFTLTLNAELN